MTNIINLNKLQFIIIPSLKRKPPTYKYVAKHRGVVAHYSRGRDNVQSTHKWEVNNLFVQLIFQFCAVNFSRPIFKAYTSFREALYKMHTMRGVY